VLVRYDQASFVGRDDQLRAVVGVELRHDPAGMGLGGEGTEVKASGNVVTWTGRYGWG